METKQFIITKKIAKHGKQAIIVIPKHMFFSKGGQTATDKLSIIKKVYDGFKKGLYI